MHTPLHVIEHVHNILVPGGLFNDLQLFLMEPFVQIGDCRRYSQYWQHLVNGRRGNNRRRLMTRLHHHLHALDSGQLLRWYELAVRRLLRSEVGRLR